MSAVGPLWRLGRLLQWQHNAVRSELLPYYEAVELLLLLLWPTDCSSSRGMELYGTSPHFAFLFSECSFVSQGQSDILFSPWVNRVFPNQMYMEIAGVGKQSIPGLIKCVKIKCRKIPLYYLLGNSPASEFSGELPRRKHTTFRIRRKFEIKNNFIQLSIIENIPWNTFSFYVFEQDL